LQEFTARGWLDDTQFARAWIEDRADRKQYGRRRLAAELRQRGVDAETVSEAIGSVDEEDEVRRALAAASKRWVDVESLSHEEAQAQNRRLAGYLMRRGFSSRVVTQVLKDLTQNSP
jgi:regulatory protein